MATSLTRRRHTFTFIAQKRGFRARTTGTLTNKIRRRQNKTRSNTKMEHTEGSRQKSQWRQQLRIGEQLMWRALQKCSDRRSFAARRASKPTTLNHSIVATAKAVATSHRSVKKLRRRFHLTLGRIENRIQHLLNILSSLLTVKNHEQLFVEPNSPILSPRELCYSKTSHI